MWISEEAREFREGGEMGLGAGRVALISKL